MGKTSAGILCHRTRDGVREVLLVHPGVPLWKNKDLGAWSIRKGEYQLGEDPLKVAKREFREETGKRVLGEFTELRPVVQKGGKMVRAFAVACDVDVSKIRSNNFEMEWPPGSGKLQAFPEVDRAEWFDLGTAKLKLNAAQGRLIEELGRLFCTY